MRSYPHNPRLLSTKRAKQLKADLELYGDLGGIVHDLNSDQLVGSHQLTELLTLLNRLHNLLDEMLARLIEIAGKLSTEKAGDK